MCMLPYAAGIQELFQWEKEKEEPRAVDVTLNEETVNRLKNERGISFGDRATLLAHFFKIN